MPTSYPKAKRPQSANGTTSLPNSSFVYRLSSNPLLIPLISHAHQEPYKEHAHERKRTTIRNERQRKPCHRHKANRHRDIHRNVEQKDRRGPHRHKRHERVVIRLANRGRTPQEQRKQHKNRSTPDKAELLPEHAKNKVRMFFGQKRKIRLRTVSKTLALNAAAPDSSQ